MNSHHPSLLLDKSSILLVEVMLRQGQRTKNKKEKDNEYKLCCITYFARSEPDQQKTLYLELTVFSQRVIIPSTESNRDKHPWGGYERMKFNKHELF